jgi:predicted RNA binding protein YcfA (HicA-like mRNA interferase family)
VRPQQLTVREREAWHEGPGGPKLIEEDGWFLIATRGSHRQYKHPTKAGRMTVAGKLSDDLAPGTLNSILKQADLKEKR